MFATEVGDDHPETLMNHVLKLMAEEVKVVKGGFVGPRAINREWCLGDRGCVWRTTVRPGAKGG